MSSYDGLDDSSEAHLTERRRAGMPLNTFRAVVAIVVVLLLINVYALTQLINPSVIDDDDGDETEPILHPWNITVEAQVIDEDTTWTARNGPLEAPLVVADGATLRLEDCHIELLMEDFIFFRAPYITVERGGRLEIVSSTLELVMDPWLEHTLVGPVYNRHEYPYMSRVVNLTDTEAPVVSFDVKWKREGTRLAVAVQPTPESGLVTLDTLEPTGSPSNWSHLSVSLSDYIGMDVNVVLYAPDFPRDVLFIHNLMVTDGGVLLPHDLPLSENGLMQYWLRDEFVTFDNAFMWFGHYSQLIFAEGDVVVVDSDLVSPEVRRRGDRDYMHNNARHGWSSKNIRASTGDWNIWLDGVDLTVRDSVIENIPVEVNNSSVSVESAIIRSNYDMFTLFGSSGRFGNSTFTSDGVSDSLRWWWRETRALWAISVENNNASTPVDIIDCEFRGVGQAIDMGYAYVNVNGCEFQDVTNLTVWNHHSEGTATWEDLEANNVFRDCTGFLYLQTRRTSVEINASDIGSRYAYAYDTDGEMVDDFGVHPEMYRYLMHWGDRGGWLTNPQVLVESKDRIRHIGHVNISVRAEIYGDEYLEGDVVFNVSPYDETVYLDTYPSLKEEKVDWWDLVSAPISLRALYPTPLCETAGAYSLLVRIYTNYLYAANVTIDFIVGDVLIRRYYEWDPMEVDDRYIWIWENLTFGPGAHRLDLVVSGLVIDENMNLSEEPVVIGNMTYHLMRVNTTTSSTSLRGFLGNDNAFLLMDPGADVEIVGLEPEEIGVDRWQRHFIRVIGAENASLTLRDSAFDGKADLLISYLDPLDIHVTGGGFLNLEVDTNSAYEYIETDQPTEIVNTFTFDNFTVGYLSATLRRCHMDVSDLSNTIGFYFYGGIYSSIYVQRCDLYTVYSSFWGPITSIVLEDCVFTGEYNSGVRLATTAEGNVRVSNCTFNGAWLTIVRDNDYWTVWSLSVTDCVFLDGAYLGVLWNPYDLNMWVYPPNALPIPTGTIEDNIFIGDGTGMLLHHKLYGGFLGDNQLDDESRLWAWYMTDTQALCSDPGARGTSNLIILDEPVEFEPTLGYYGWPFKDDIIIDVTDDPGSALDPPPRGAVLTWSHNYGRPASVMGYGEIDLTKDHNVLFHPLWPDLQTILPDYVEPWPIPMDFS